MKTRSAVLVGFFGLVILSGAVAGSALSANSTHSFIENASIGGQFEISSSRLALQNSQNAAIKTYAQEMIDDHSQISNDMKGLISSTNPDADQPNVSMDEKHQAMLDKLNSAKGKDFDKLYVKDQIKAHDEALDLFKSYAKSGENSDIKTFAAQTLPTLEKHKADIEQLKKSM